MLIRVLSFGSNWWARFGRYPEDRYRYTRHAAYFNSTGLCHGTKIKRHWIVPGLVRFNGASDFDPHSLNRLRGVVFECGNPTFALGGNRIWFRRRARVSAQPDCFLIAITSELYGVFDFDGFPWESDSVLPIAVSSFARRQEALLLMRPHARIRTMLGTWQLRTESAAGNGAHLELLEEGTSA